MAVVSIPLMLKDVTGGIRRVEAPGSSVDEVVASLEVAFPGIEARIRDGDKLLPIITVTVDGKLATDGLSTSVGPESEVCMLPSFGGG